MTTKQSTRGRYSLGDGEYLIPTSVAYHRNGVAGNGFHVVLFDYFDGETLRSMVATVFDECGSTAVLALDELNKGNVAFAGGNSWRGDNFEGALRLAIKKYDDTRVSQS